MGSCRFIIMASYMKLFNLLLLVSVGSCLILIYRKKVSLQHQGVILNRISFN